MAFRKETVNFFEEGKWANS